MSVTTIRNATRSGNRTRRRRNNVTYYNHECPVCHAFYTTHAAKSRHCGQPACARIVNEEEAVNARSKSL